MSFSWNDREMALKSVETQPAELLVIGGGVVGCSIAAHAANLGLNVVLLEKEDFASGASGNSTGLAHAGLRYLAQGRIGYVLKEARERLLLQRLAPQWVRPFSFIFPVYQRDPFGLLSIHVGTALYDFLYRWAGRGLPIKAGERYKMLGVPDVLARVPGLAAKGLTGATEYFVDARLIDSRFTLGFAQKAAQLGARLIPRASVVSFLKTGERIVGLQSRDEFTGQSFEVKASLVINATGPWIDEMRKLAGLQNPVLQNSKGVHLIVDRIAENPLILSTSVAGQVFFVIPFGRTLSLVGTTDTPQAGPPGEAKAQDSDVAELVQRLFTFFPTLKSSQASSEEAVRQYRQEHVHEVYWGVRPLLGGGPSTIHASREHRLLKESNGLWSVPGVKLTAGRVAGEEVAREAWRTLRGSRPPTTRVETLPGGELDFETAFKKLLHKEPKRSEDQLKYLIGRYGTRAIEVLRRANEDPALNERVLPDESWIYAEVAYAVDEEMALTLNDLLWRRTRWARLRALPEDTLFKVADVQAKILNWSPEERNHQVALFQSELKAHQLL